MQTLLLALLLVSELSFSRAMFEDAAIRNDGEGLRLVRERLLRLIADSDDTTILRDAHYLAALSAQFEIYGGERDAGETASLVATGMRHADRAVALDPKFADGWMLAAMFRGTARRMGIAVPPDPEGAPNRFARAVELDPNAPGVAVFHGMIRSFNPAGPAGAEGVKIFEQLLARLEADRAATGRRFGVWDDQAHAWMLFVRLASDEPDHAALRPAAARFLAERPDSALARQLSDTVAQRTFVTAPDVQWQRVLDDPAGDGSDPKRPDVVAVDRAERGERLWYRVTFREPLPRSFGVNLVFDRDGDPSTGMRWWGKGSTFRFDRLVTAWISRDGERYAGTVGVTDDDGARGTKLVKIPADVQLAIGSNALMIGVPRDALGLTGAAAMIAAGGTHLAWNDDATSASNSR